MKTLKTNALLLAALVAVGQNAAIFAAGEEKSWTDTVKSAWHSTLGAVSSPIVTSKAAFVTAQTKDRALRTNNFGGLYTGAAVLGSVYAAKKAFGFAKYGYSKLPSFRSKSGNQPADKGGKDEVSAPVVSASVVKTAVDKMSDTQIMASPAFLNYLQNERNLTGVGAMAVEHKKLYVAGYRDWVKAQNPGLKTKVKGAVLGVGNVVADKAKGFTSIFTTPFGWLKTAAKYPANNILYNAVFKSSKLGKYAPWVARGGLVAATAGVVGLGLLGRSSYQKEDGYVPRVGNAVASPFKGAWKMVPNIRSAKAEGQPEGQPKDEKVSFVAQNAEKDAQGEDRAKLEADSKQLKAEGTQIERALSANAKAIAAKKAELVDQQKRAAKNAKKRPVDTVARQQLISQADEVIQALLSERVGLEVQAQDKTAAKVETDAEIAKFVVSYADRFRAGKERAAGWFIRSEKTEEVQTTDEQTTDEQTTEDNKEEAVEVK